MTKYRLDNLLAKRKITQTRSQAENLIRLGEVLVDGRVIDKPGYFVKDSANITITAEDHYVSRAGLKLASIAKDFLLDFKNKVVLDVGSSTGGFTDFALQNGAKRVIAVDVGKDQLHPSLRSNDKVDLYEQTDIRDFIKIKAVNIEVDIIVIDVSFISLREILPFIKTICKNNTEVVAMLKPQFEIGANAKHKGVIKNEKLRRDVIKDFEAWLKSKYKIISKSDSKITGFKGNLERFYLLKAI